MTKQTELMTVSSEPMPVAAIAANPISDMLRAVIDKGVTPDNVSALEKIVGLYERMEEKNAEKMFAASFVALQQDMPVIVAQTQIPNRGKYERFEDVMHVVGPLLTKHGFAVSFSNAQADNRITETCHLHHVGGHSKSNSFTVRVGRADTETQADCKAATTAKRNALLNCLNIVIRQDCLQDETDDPRNEGDFITKAQAEELQRRVRETESDEIKFLALAGVTGIAGKPTLKTYESIMSSRYPELDAALSRKEQRGR